MQRILAVLIGLFLVAFAGIMGTALMTYRPMVALAQTADRHWGDALKAAGDQHERAGALLQSGSLPDSPATGGLQSAWEKLRDIPADPNQAPFDPARFSQLQKAQDDFLSALSKVMDSLTKPGAPPASEQRRELLDALKSGMERIELERARYNAAASKYNLRISAFPNLIVARVFRFLPKPRFVSHEPDQPPKLPKEWWDLGPKPQQGAVLIP